jgi:hypothetical protein
MADPFRPLRRQRWWAERNSPVNATIDDLDRIKEETFTYDVSDEELEALAAEAGMRMWTRVTTSCGGPSPGPECR